VWDIEGGVEIRSLTDYGSEVWGVAWSVDGSIASAGQFGDVRIHSLDLEALERAARDRVTRSLTDAECRQYLHLDVCP
jgi:WD40 repeat protein